MNGSHAWWRTAVAIVSLTTATAIIIDDWRHARWVNADYGFRLDVRGAAFRYWLDCAGSIIAFFLISTSFIDPTNYLIWLCVFFTIGGLWAWRLQVEIKRYIKSFKEYPPNSLGLSKREADAISPQSPETADYRVDFVLRSQFIIALGFGVLAAFSYLGDKAAHNAPLAFANVVLTTGLPLGVALLAKALYHDRRRKFFRLLDNQGTAMKESS